MKQKTCNICHHNSHHNDKYCVCCHHKFSTYNHWELTLVWLITGMILYIPANVLPIMEMQVLGEVIGNNIFDGVVNLWQQQSYFIASIIFFASIFIPVSKFIVILLLLFYNNQYFKKQKIPLYKLLEKVGRWSMIDIFVVILLTIILQIEGFVTVIPGVATLTFLLSIMFTMLSVNSLEIKQL